MRTRVRAIVGSLFAGGLTTTLQTCSLYAFLQSAPLLGYVVLTDVNLAAITDNGWIDSSQVVGSFCS
jgi:hypothetical protein